MTELDDFLDFSVEATAFTRFELLGTGQAEAYYQAAESVVGPMLGELLVVYRKLPSSPAHERKTAMRRTILGDEKLGPIARSIAKLWYIGIWYALPPAWTEAYGALPNNITFMVSAASYAEGLLWVAIGAHPPGAKAPGYGSWAAKPTIPKFASACRCEDGDDGRHASAPAPALVQAPPGGVAPPPASTPQHPSPAPGSLS